MRAFLVAAAAIAALPLAGCGNADNFATGALVGGAAGGIVGSALSRPGPVYAAPPAYYRPSYYEPRPYWRHRWDRRDRW